MKFLTLIVAALMLAGCVTSTTVSSTTAPVKAENLYLYQAKSSVDDAKVIVKRDEGFVGGGCYTGFFVNGKLAGKFDVNETAAFYMPSGDYIFGYGKVKGNGLCGFADTEPKRERETILKAGETKRFRLFIDQGGNFDILPTTLQ